MDGRDPSELEASAELRGEAETRAAAEAQLRHDQKMTAVRRLTGGIAHDLNNILAVVVGGLDLARRRLTEEASEAGRHIDDAMAGADRAAALTRRLLAFARVEPLLPEAIAPAARIAAMSDRIGHALGERIRLDTRLDASAWQVWCDPGQLEDAILNLAANARDAIAGAGRVVVAAGNVTLGEGEIGEARGGDHVRIAVTDDGCGMTAEVIDRAFEPFFTTRPVGHGTGLGLSQVYGFARQSGGAVAIDSAPGCGTTVSLYLPRHAAAASQDAPPAPFGAAGPAVILVVEDDPRVRNATAGALAELGHEPLPAAGGGEALAVLAARGDIRLIVSDVVMPEMTGPELIARAAPLYPDVAVLYVTGYAGEAGALAGREVLRKPFTVRALELAVARALAPGPIERAAAVAG